MILLTQYHKVFTERDPKACMQVALDNIVGLPGKFLQSSLL